MHINGMNKILIKNARKNRNKKLKNLKLQYLA